MLVDVESEVTVMVTTHTTPIGVLVIEKLLEACVVFWEVEKKLAPPPSGAEEMAIVTPLEGMADVIETFRLKLGPTAGAWTVLTAGLVVTANVASGVLLLPEEQLPRKARIAIAKTGKRRFLLWNACCIAKGVDY